MDLRKRVMRGKDYNLILKQDILAEGDRSAKPNAQTGGIEEAFLFGSVNCSGSAVLCHWPWQHRVSMAAGLLLAGLLALTQSWCVNTIHENLLWFSQLTVGVISGIIDMVFNSNL